MSTPSKLLAIQFWATVYNITVSVADYHVQLFEVAGGSQDLRSQLREVCVSSAVEGRSTVLLVDSSSCSSQHWENICKIMNEGVLTLAFCPKPPPLIQHTCTHTCMHTWMHTHTHMNAHMNAHTLHLKHISIGQVVWTYMYVVSGFTNCLFRGRHASFQSLPIYLQVSVLGYSPPQNCWWWAANFREKRSRKQQKVLCKRLPEQFIRTSMCSSSGTHMAGMKTPLKSMPILLKIFLQVSLSSLTIFFKTS